MNEPFTHDDTWKQSAACIGTPTDLFFPHPKKPSEPAILICTGCVVRPDCLEYAKRTNSTQGIFGGRTPRGRRP